MNLKNIKVGDAIEFYMHSMRPGKVIYCKHIVAKVTKTIATTENGLKFAIPSGCYIDDISGRPTTSLIAEKVNPLKFKKKVSPRQVNKLMSKLTPSQQVMVKRIVFCAARDSSGAWDRFVEEHDQIAVAPK